MQRIISGATVVDAVSGQPIEGRSIWIEGERIRAIAKPDELPALPTADIIDARGKYVIPGLMNANVHLLCDFRLETLVRYLERYDELIAEAAQVALKNGLTTVFDTWGPRRFLMAVRDRINRAHLEPGGDNLFDLAGGHFAWLRAMEQKGCPPMEMLRAATRNIAVAYGKGRDLGTIEPGKIADLLILDRNPLHSAENYRSIRAVIKAGVPIDRDSLPTDPILTKPGDPPSEEEASYVSFLTDGSQFPGCPMCMRE